MRTAALCGVAILAALSPWWSPGPATVRDARRPARRSEGAGGRGRRGRRARDVAVDAVLLLDVVDAALVAGASVPRALDVVGEALGGDEGDSLRRAGTALLLGASWSSAWARSPDPVRPLADALESAWTSGVAPGLVLRARADQLRREHRTRTREAAARVGVHLVLPLGLCFLPAFVLLGLVPLVLSLAAGVMGGVMGGGDR